MSNVEIKKFRTHEDVFNHPPIQIKAKNDLTITGGVDDFVQTVSKHIDYIRNESRELSEILIEKAEIEKNKLPNIKTDEEKRIYDLLKQRHIRENDKIRNIVSYMPRVLLYNSVKYTGNADDFITVDMIVPFTLRYILISGYKYNNDTVYFDNAKFKKYVETLKTKN